MLFGCDPNSTSLTMEDSLRYNQLHLLQPATEYNKILFSVVCVFVSLFNGGGSPCDHCGLFHSFTWRTNPLQTSPPQTNLFKLILMCKRVVDLQLKGLLVQYEFIFPYSLWLLLLQLFSWSFDFFRLLVWIAIQKYIELIQQLHLTTLMAYFHCRTWIWIQTRTQIPVLCRCYGKGILNLNLSQWKHVLHNTM